MERLCGRVSSSHTTTLPRSSSKNFPAAAFIHRAFESKEDPICHLDTDAEYLADYIHRMTPACVVAQAHHTAAGSTLRRSMLTIT